jgi:hypothetical protein
LGAGFAAGLGAGLAGLAAAFGFALVAVLAVGLLGFAFFGAAFFAGVVFFALVFFAPTTTS